MDAAAPAVGIAAAPPPRPSHPLPSEDLGELRRLLLEVTKERDALKVYTAELEAKVAFLQSQSHSRDDDSDDEDEDDDSLSLSPLNTRDAASVSSPTPHEATTSPKPGGFRSKMAAMKDKLHWRRVPIGGGDAQSTTTALPLPMPIPADPNNWAIVRVWLPGPEGTPWKISTCLREDIDGGGVGHVSLEIPNQYWSWWPYDEVAVTMFQSIVGVKGKHHTLAEDEEYERDWDTKRKCYVEGAKPRQADVAIVFRSLDMERIVEKMKYLQRHHPNWDLRSNSCATTVASIIRAGCYGGPKFVLNALDRGLEGVTGGSIAPDTLARSLWDLAKKRELFISDPNPTSLDQWLVQTAPPRAAQLSSFDGKRGIVFCRYTREQIRWRNMK